MSDNPNVIPRKPNATLSFAQELDLGNTKVVSLADASPGSPWIGAWALTRTAGIVRELTVLASNVSMGLGGTFTFQFSEDGIAPTISETRVIGDFSTVRDFDLINAGAYYRVKFEPSRILIAGELVFVNTTLRPQNDGAFVRLANQEIEEENAAMGQTFAYAKAFSATTGKSVNIRPTDLSPGNSSTTLLGVAGVFPGVIASCLGLNGITVFVISDQPGTLAISFGDGVTMGVPATRNYPGGTAAQGYVFLPVASHFRVTFTNTGAAQATFLLQTIQVAGALSSIFARLDTPIGDGALAQQVRAVMAAKAIPQGGYGNITSTVAETSGHVGLDVVVNIPGTAGYISAKVTTVAITEVAIRNTAYTEQAAGAQRSFSSTVAADAAAGTGMRTIRFTYYTLTGIVVAGPFTETLVLNGVTPVNTVATNICYVDLIEGLTVGSGGTNAGIIQMFAAVAGGGGVFASIAIGDRKSFYGHKYVATGSTLNITAIKASSLAASANVPTFIVRSRNLAIADAIDTPLADGIDVQGSTGFAQVTYDTPRKVVGPARFTALVVPANATSQLQRLEVGFYEVPS